MTPVFSIIVPVYNSSAYLERCLKSIINQKFKDWECILIDDGSTDNSGVICDRYSGIDNRLRVIHKSNGGVSSARNEGLRASKGDYIVFVDSDDYIGDEHLSSFSKHVAEAPDLIMGPENKMFPNHLQKTQAPSIEHYDLAVNIYIIWTSCYKTSIILNNNIWFDEKLSHGEDSLFFLRAFLNSKKIACTRHYYEYERGHEGGLNIRFHPYKEEEYSYDRIHDVTQELNTKYKANKMLYKWTEFFRIVRLLFDERTEMSFSDKVKELIRLSAKYKLRELDANGIPLGQKILYKLLYWRLFFTSSIYMRIKPLIANIRNKR